MYALDSTIRNSPEEPRLFPLPPPVWLSLLPDAARELLVTGDIITPQGDRRRAHRSEAAEVERVLAIFVPASVRYEDPAIVAEVMSAVRECISAAKPHDALSARQMMWALTPMLVSLRRRLGSLDVAMLNDRNVEAWVNTTNKHKTNGWRHLARTCLRRVGRAVNPHGFTRSKKIGRSPIAPPYNLEVEAVFGQVAGLPRPGDQPGRLLVAGGGFGGGLNGVQLLAAETGDLREVGNGRLAIQVRGHNERLVPIRADWTEAVRQAARLAQERQGNESSTRIIRAADKNAVSRLAASLDFGQGRLSLRRARTTWLTAHLLAGTPYHVLRVIAGSLSAQTLIELSELAIEEIDPEQAVIEGLRA